MAKKALATVTEERETYHMLEDALESIEEAQREFDRLERLWWFPAASPILRTSMLTSLECFSAVLLSPRRQKLPASIRILSAEVVSAFRHLAESHRRFEYEHS